MAKKDKAETATVEPRADHTVEYTETSGEKITATFPTEEHAAVLRNRLTAHGIAHTYSGPAVEPLEMGE